MNYKDFNQLPASSKQSTWDMLVNIERLRVSVKRLEKLRGVSLWPKNL